MTLSNQVGTQIRKIDKYYIHEEFTSRLNDVMVVKIDEPFTLSEYVDIIKMADEGFDPNGSLCLLFILLFLSSTLQHFKFYGQKLAFCNDKAFKD